jgi:hypothetical protein
MGRKTRHGLEYFSVDTTWETPMKLIRAKYGLEGVGFMMELYASIYRESYYRKWDEETELLFSDEIKKPVEYIRELIEYCFTRGLLDRDKYDAFGVLTSHGIQQRYFDTCFRIRRTSHDIRPELYYEDLVKSMAFFQSSEEKGITSEEKPISSEEKGITSESIPRICIGIGIGSSKATASHAQAREAGGGCPKSQEVQEAIASAPWKLTLSTKELETIANRLEAQGVEVGKFIAWAVATVKAAPGVKSHAGFFKSGLLTYDDWFAEYKAGEEKAKGQKAKEVRYAKKPNLCICGDAYKANLYEGLGICLGCSREYVYDWQAERWEEGTVQNDKALESSA